MELVFSNHKRIGDDLFVVGVGGRTVSNETRVSVSVGGQSADFMRYGLAEVLRILRDVGNNVPFFQRCGIDLLDKHQIARCKIGCLHGV